MQITRCVRCDRCGKETDMQVCGNKYHAYECVRCGYEGQKKIGVTALEACYRGYDDYVKSKALSDCPYDDHMLRNSWCDGFGFAEFDDIDASDIDASDDVENIIPF